MSESDQVGIVVKGKRYLTINDACLMMAVSRRTVYNWLALGKVRAGRSLSGKLYIEHDSIDMTPVSPDSIKLGY